MSDQNSISLEDKETSRASEPASIYQRGSSSTSGSGYNPSVYTSPYSQKAATPPAAPAKQAEASAADAATDRKLTIGRGITMSGEIESCEHLYVEGTVEAALKGAKVLEIAESGVFYGTVEIEEATISGRFEGDITVQGRLTIESSGVITGSISYGELQVESGAVIDGRLTPVAVKSSAKPAAPAAARDEAISRAASPAAKLGGALFEDSEEFEAAE